MKNSNNYKLVLVGLIMLVGYFGYSQNISNSFSRSTIISNKNSAGLIAEVSEAAVISNSYSAGLILSDDEDSKGGLIATADAQSQAQFSYWDNEVAKTNSSVLGLSRSTEQMTYPYTGSTYTGWNFGSVWNNDINSVNRGYPFLNFNTPVLYDLSVKTSNQSIGSAEGSNQYSYKAYVIAVALPDQGYELENWTDNNDNVLSLNSEYKFYMPAHDHSVTANFRLADYVVTVDVYPPNSGSIEGAGSFHFNDVVNLTATPAAGYRFLNWQDDTGQVISENPELSLTVGTSDIFITANFEISSSVTENSLLQEILVSPNPTDRYVNIESNILLDEVSVIGVNGQLIKRFNAIQFLKLDLNNYPNGMYWLNFKSGNKTASTSILKHY